MCNSVISSSIDKLHLSLRDFFSSPNHFFQFETIDFNGPKGIEDNVKLYGSSQLNSNNKKFWLTRTDFYII